MITAHFIPIPSRSFVTLDLALEDVLAGIPYEEFESVDDAIVRARLSGSAEQMRKVDQDKLRQGLLAMGAHSVRLDVDVERTTRRRAEISEQLSAVEAMALYCDAIGIEDPLREELLSLIKDWSQE